MARSPLFGSVSRAFRVATIASRERPDLPPVDELIDMCYSRRRFLGASAAVAAALATGCGRTEAPPPVQTTPPPSGRPQTPRIAIVGAGVAGLNAAYKLKQAGLTATVYEGANRTGGRMFTATDLLGPGLTTELGGEFIDSTHTEMLALMTEFGLDKLDVQAPAYASLKPETYFVNGRHYTQAQAARAFVPLAKRIAKDYDALGDVVNYNTEGGGTAIDRQTITQYFDHIGATGWMRELLDVAYVTEYGLDAGEQSALNFVFLIGTGDLEAKDELTLLGESDERYKVKGGNQRVVDELARRVASQIRPLHRLEAIRSRNGGYTLTFQADGKAIDEDAEIVLLAIPFSILRDVKISVDLPPLKTRAIRDLGYGTNAKVLVGFKNRPWEKLGYTGATYSDESFQLAWSNSFMQAGPAGGLTLYSGGRLGIDAGQGTAEEAAVRLMGGIERAYPGTTNDRNGKVSRFHWPSYPWTKGSYSCYKPGQWTTIAGSEGLPVGDLFFAGEHCSYDFQGFMNGGAQSGADAAKAIMGRASTAKAARVYSRRALVHLA
ncbi:MAG: NAD(P)/FAD-dependent oxidoreductase [Acidobacteriota bacterium]